MLTILFFGKSGTIQSLSVGKRRVVPVGESLREVFGRWCSRLSSGLPLFFVGGLANLLVKLCGFFDSYQSFLFLGIFREYELSLIHI